MIMMRIICTVTLRRALLNTCLLKRKRLRGLSQNGYGVVRHPATLGLAADPSFDTTKYRDGACLCESVYKIQGRRPQTAAAQQVVPRIMVKLDAIVMIIPQAYQELWYT